MKKVLFLLVVVLTASYAKAQLKVGIQAGAGMTNMFIGNKEASIGDATDFKPGFRIGAIAEIDNIQEFTRGSMAFQTGLLVAMQGYKKSFPVDQTFNLTYLQIPANFVFKRHFSSMKLLGQVGPYLGYAIDGKRKWEYRGEEVEEKIKFGNGKDDFMKAFDIGFGAGGGLQFGNFQAKIELSASMLNLSNITYIERQNFGLSFTAAYLFGL